MARTPRAGGICEKTLSLRHIDTPRRERFYWATSLIAFALGTATGHTLINTIALAWKWLHLLSNPHDKGGLGLGQWPVSAAFAVALIVVLACTPRAALTT